MANELEIPGGIKTTNNVEADAWAGPYASLAAARAAVPTIMRLYRTVKIIEGSGIVEYVWKNGTADGDLVIKASVVDLASESQYGTTTYGTQAETEDAADNPTLGSISAVETVHLRGLRWFLNRVLATARAITGVWTAPTAALGTNTTQLATAAFVQQEKDEAPVDLGSVASGTIVLDLSRKNFLVTLTGTVTLDYTNLVIGREYCVRIERSTATVLNFIVNKWAAPLAAVPGLTNPTQNGSSPAKAVDFLTFKAMKTGDRPTVVITPDAQNI